MRRRLAAMSLTAVALVGCAEKAPAGRKLAGADTDRGHEIIQRLACAACHKIPGVEWPEGRTGGSLAGFGSRPLIAGRFPNRPDVLTRWLRDAPSLAPDTGMPQQNLSQAEARDVAAYLYTLE